MDVRAVGITKEFGALAALNGVDLNVGSGELMALLGPSGSGKTTLLRVIAGLENAEAGQIYFGAEDATDIPVRHRGVGFVFQHYALFKHLTVFDNIAYGLRARRRNRPPSAEIRNRVMTLLDLVQLAGLEKRFPNQLSGGQRQRVALARALAVEPRVLLLDEPFGALDARVRKDLRRWLREVHDQTGRTTIFVTHDQDEALELADRVTILNRGRIEQIGTPDEVHDAPASSFVMSFVGESTRLPVEIQGGQVSYRGRMLLQREAADGAGGLYLRPDDAAITPAGPDTLPGTVALMRRGAGGRRAEIRLGDSDDIIEVAVPPEMPLSRGEAVHVAIKGGRVFGA